MDNTASQQRSAPADALARGPWFLGGAGAMVFFLAWFFQGEEARFWLPGLGVGIALVSWLGWRILPVLSVVLLLARCAARADGSVAQIFADTALHIAHIALAWWLYHEIAHGSRWLDDPRSATIFLILVPGALSATAAVVQASYSPALNQPDATLLIVSARFWLSRMVGILVVVPFFIVILTPRLLRHRMVDIELPPAFFGEREGDASRLGEGIELFGLTFATSVLALLLLLSHVTGHVAIGMLWATCMVLIVWTCIRQGLSGGCFSASVTSVAVLTAAQILGIPPDNQADIQGNLLAFCSTALLVGVSASWIRANETRYRHVVGRIPFVVYSARLPHGISPYTPPDPGQPRRDSKTEIHIGPSISKLANVLLVSPACKQVLGCEADALIGPFELFLEQIAPEDRELVIAALTQICLQKQPVTCEYRLRAPLAPPPAEQSPSAPPRLPPLVVHRWVRDTLTPHYSEEGLIDGWEGLIEDITDQRNTSHNLRKMTTMLQALITNLPTGVYFVQGPQGFPLLVNARARQLLGQREDLSAGMATLSKLFRLFRPDGTEYPWEELPVCKALLQGVTCRANDIVVQRPDGRRIPLITWAAPIDLHGTGTIDAAVWVLEDWSAMQQAEVALRESELRLRAIIETMVEGVVLQDAAGAIIECNPAACAILGVAREKLMNRVGLFPDTGCLQEDGTALPSGEQPDQQALHGQKQARSVIVGIPLGPEVVRWLLVNSVPLPVGPVVGLNPQRARIVTTFADITPQVRAQDSLRHTRDKYQNLIETLPFMLVQRDKDFNITYLNPAATQLTGHTAAEFMQPGFCQGILHPDDISVYLSVAKTVAQGKSTRVEVRFLAKDGSVKTVLAFFHPNLHHGEVVGSTSLVIDITMQRRLEEELINAKRLELVGRLASGIVHDFNHFLTVIMGFAGCAKAELAKDHAAWQYLSRIEDAGEQAAHLSGQLLTFSKQRPKQSQPVDLNAVVTQTLKLSKSVMPTAVTVETSLEPSLPTVLGDENQLKQVVMNFILNARDAMPDGGALTIRTDRTAPSDADGKTWVHLSIQDTGHGMPDEVRSRVFEAFFSTKEHGTGLGLAVVEQIIKEAGGVINVWSKPGEGTRFDIWLAR